MSKAIIFGFDTHKFSNQDANPQRIWYKFTNRILGPYIVAEKFRNHGIEAEVIDYLPFWTDDEIRQFLKLQQQNDIQYIGFNCTLPPLDHVKKYVDICKEYFPNATYIAGGQQSFKGMDIGCDYYVAGFAEKAMEAILDHDLNNGELVSTPLYSGKLVETIRGPYETHLLPDYQTYYHESDNINANDVLILELGRGCKFSCSFCNFSLIGLKKRTIRDSKDIRAELIRNYELYGVTNYFLGDDTPNESNERLQALVDAVDGLDFKPTFGGFVRLDLINAYPEQIELMAKARFISHYYGVETLNHSAGKHIGKGLNSDKIKKTLLETRDYIMKEVGEYHGDIGLIIGVPHESLESIQATYEWAYENWRGKGQNIIWFPLQITQGDLGDSKIGLNPEKYGYTEMIEPKNKDLFLEIGKASVAGSYLWQNEHTNVIDAAELMIQYRQAWDDETRCSSFVEALTVNARLGSLDALENSNGCDDFLKISHAHLKEYKNKKLKKC